MTIRHVEIGGSAGTGSESDPYNDPLTAYNAAISGDTIRIRAPLTNQWIPTTNIQDTKGIKWESWASILEENQKVNVNCSALTGSFALRLENVLCECSYFRLHSIPSGKFGIRYHQNLSKFGYIICEDSAGTGIVVQSGFTGQVKWDRVITRRCQVGVRWDNCGGVGAIMDLFACESHGHTLYDRVRLKAGTLLNIHFNFNGGNKSYMYWGEAAHAGAVHLYNTVMIQGFTDFSATETIRNDSTASGTFEIHNGVATKQIFDTSPFNLGFSGAGTITIDPTMRGDTTPVKKLFKTPRREASVCFKRDDCEEYVVGGSFAGEMESWLDELEARGLKGSYSLSSRQGDNPNNISEAGWAELKTVVTRGHEMGTEGTTGAHLFDVDMFTMQYTGAATVCRLVIANNKLQTFEDGVLDLDIALPDTLLPIGSLRAIIDANGSYTGVNDSSDGGLMNARVLADIDIADIKASSHTLVIDTDRAWAFELGLCKQDIIDRLGVVPVTHTYSTGSYSQSAADYMSANGWVGARVGVIPNPANGSTPFPFTDNKKVMSSFGVLTGALNKSTLATLAVHIDAWCQWAMLHGAAICFYDHEYATTSLAEWQVIFDTVIASGIRIDGTMKAQYEWMANVAVPTTADDDAWEGKIASDSELAISSIRSWTGANPLDANKYPRSDIEDNIGPWKSFNSIFDPAYKSNLDT